MNTQSHPPAKAAHTLRYSLRPVAGHVDQLLVDSQPGYPIARLLAGDALIDSSLALPGDEEEARAEMVEVSSFVLRACNSYDSLVQENARLLAENAALAAALEKIAKKAGEDYDERDPLETVGGIARAALASAKGDERQCDRLAELRRAALAAAKT